jgi:hypothetical protein
MLQTVTDATGAPYHTGTVTGVHDPVTRDAMRRFQGDHGLDRDGLASSATRRALIEQYMLLERTTLPADAKLVTHGCGKSHPVDATAAADAGNRRVEIFLFDGSVDPAPTQPCPLAGCAQYPIWIQQTTEEVDLCLPETFDFDFLVQDDRTPPQPIPAAQVSINAPGITPVIVGGDGRGTLEEVPAGTWELTATHPEFPTKTQPITVPIAAVAPPPATQSALAAAPPLSNAQPSTTTAAHDHPARFTVTMKFLANPPNPTTTLAAGTNRRSR